MTRYLTARAFGEAVGVTDRTVRDWVRQGLLRPAGRTPTGRLRFTEEQVREVIEHGRPTERARDLEAHVIAARERLRLRRSGRSA